MKRTAQYASRLLNRGKRRQLLKLVEAVGHLKSHALSAIGRPVAWHYLDFPRALRDPLKSRYIFG